MYVRKKMSIRKTAGFPVYKRRRSEISSHSDTSTSSNGGSRNSSKPLKRFNRLFRTSVARHWLFFTKTRLSAGVRGRSVSDAGLCSIVDHDLDPDYLDISTSCSHRSLQVIGSEASRDSFDLAPSASPLSRSAAGSSSAGVEEASDGSDAERPKKGQYLRVPAPAFPGQSTGNFASGAAGGGCGAARSAPATPLQLEPHPRTSKHDKNPVKPLSGSVPSVRAATAQADAAAPKHPYKARQKKFQRHFPQVGPEERVLDYYSCALVGDLLLQGHLYITKNYFAFYSNVFGYVTKLLIPTTSVLRITKEKIARIIPNAVGVCTRDERHVFGSLLSRDATYKLMLHVWKAARVPELVPDPPDVRTSEVELDASEYSPGDDSSSGGGADRPDAPVTPARRDSEAILTTGGAAIIQPVLLAGAAGAAGVAGVGAGAGGGWRWARGVLLAATVLLACSAALLAHRLYGLPSGARAQDDVHKLSGQALYSELVRWRARLHGQAATELHAFLTTNMLLLAKVRQSLEALSGEIMTDMAQGGAPHINIEVPNDTVYS